MSEVDHATYAKATTPARDAFTLTVEDEAQGMARRIRESKGGQREYNLGIIASEIKTLERNQVNGYGGWEFRLAVLRRVQQLVNTGGY